MHTYLTLLTNKSLPSLVGEHAIAKNNREAVKIAMRDTSIDMSMTAWDTDFATDLIDLVNKGELPVERVDESVARCVLDS